MRGNTVGAGDSVTWVRAIESVFTYINSVITLSSTPGVVAESRQLFRNKVTFYISSERKSTLILDIADMRAEVLKETHSFARSITQVRTPL